MPSLSAATAVMVMLVPAANASPLIGLVMLTVGGALAAVTLAVAIPAVDAARTPAPGVVMATAANRFLASLTPAARAAHVDVLQALRSE